MNFIYEDKYHDLATIIIVNWNSGELLRKCITKLEKQTFNQFKTIIVDNASTDNSLNDVSSTNYRLVIRLKENIGFAAGNNLALRYCTTKYVVLLNPDAFPEENWIENLLIAAAENADVACFASMQLCYTDPSIIDGAGDIYHFSGLPWRNRHGISFDQTVDTLESKLIFSPCAAAAMYDRLALEDVGYFDEDFFCYLEDVDLGFRLRLAGYLAICVPNAIVYHIGSATTGGKQSDFSIYHGHRNLVWTYVKNMPTPLLCLTLPIHILLNVFSIFWFTFRGKGLIIWKAKYDALKAMPTLLSKRKIIQKGRKEKTINIWIFFDKRIIPIRKLKERKIDFGFNSKS